MNIVNWQEKEVGGISGAGPAVSNLIHCTRARSGAVPVLRGLNYLQVWYAELCRPICGG